jgi:hypothetical protein
MDADQNKVIATATSSANPGSLLYILWSENLVDNNGNITVTLPTENGGQPITFQVIGFSSQNVNEYNITGKSSIGQIGIFSHPLGKVGTINIGLNSYDILPLGTSKGVVFKKLPPDLQEGACVQNGNNPEEDPLEFCTSDCGTSLIDVLYMVTPEAKQWLNDNYGPWSFIILLGEVAKFNTALINSDIPGKHARVRIIDYTPQDFIPSQSNISYPGLPSLQSQLRDSPHANQTLVNNGADIGLYLTPNFNHFGFTGNHEVTGSPKFSIIQMSKWPFLQMSIAHEIAHNFGCEHGYDIPATECRNGKQLAGGKATIMAPGERIMNFSNPTVPSTTMGEFTGDDGSNGGPIRNNAARLKAAMCEVANNNTPIYFGASYTHTTTVHPSLPFAATATVEPGVQEVQGLNYLIDCPGPYTYQWSWSSTYNGTYLTIGTNSPNLDLAHPPSCPFFYLKLRVTTSSCVVEQLQLIHCIPEIPPYGRNSNDTDGFSKTGLPHIIPNPANDRIQVVLDGFLTVQDAVAVSANGSIITHLDSFVFENGEFKCDVSGLPSGLWFLEIKGQERNIVLKLAILR